MSPFTAATCLNQVLSTRCEKPLFAVSRSPREDVQAQLRLSEGRSLQYEKHMTHHMPRGVDLSWAVEAKHVFLIRSPARIIASYRQKMPTVSEEDIGIVRQRELFDEVSDILGERPPVMDSADVLANPEHMLQKLCHTLRYPVDRGHHDEMGVWFARQ
jgi:hypothetical protein